MFVNAINGVTTALILATPTVSRRKVEASGLLAASIKASIFQTDCEGVELLHNVCLLCIRRSEFFSPSRRQKVGMSQLLQVLLSSSLGQKQPPN